MLILFVSLTGGLAISAVIGVALWIPIRRSKLEEEAKAWPTTSARGQDGEMRLLSRYDQFPCFTLSYVVNGEYYTGSFALSAEGDRADTLLRELIDKNVASRYDPNHPSKFYVSDKIVQGCEVKCPGGVR